VTTEAAVIGEEIVVGVFAVAADTAIVVGIGDGVVLVVREFRFRPWIRTSPA